MLCDGGVLAALVAANVARYPLAAKQDLHGVTSDTHIDLLPAQVVRHAVVVPIDLDGMLRTTYRRICVLRTYVLSFW